MSTVQCRSSHLDNLKAFLIYLVVLGHLIEPMLDRSTLYKLLYILIYSFHMPLFVFISGQLLKMQQGKFKITTLAVPYMIFQMLYFFMNSRFWPNQHHSYSFFQPQWLLWFIFSLILWNLITPRISKLRYSMSLSIIIALLAGGDAQIGYFLSLSRAIVFFPFFLAGYLIDFNEITNALIKFKNAICMLSLLIVIGVTAFIDFIDVRIFYGSYSYQLLGQSFIEGIMLRTLTYIVSVLMMLAVTCLLREKQNCFTSIGQRTLGVYLLHGFVVKYASHEGLYHYLSGNDILNITILIAVSAFMVYLLSSKQLLNMIKQLFQMTEMLLIDNQNPNNHSQKEEKSKMKKGVAAAIFLLIIINIITIPANADFKMQASSFKTLAAKGEPSLTEGYYKLMTADTNLDIGMPYLFEKADEGAYKILDIKTHTALTANDLLLEEQSWKNDDSQKWILKDTDLGYTITSKKSGAYLVCTKEKLELKQSTDENLLLTINTASKTQYFRLVPMFHSTKDLQKKNSIISNQYYVITSISNAKVLQKNKAAIMLNNKSDSNNDQNLKLIKNNDGTFIIKASDSSVLGWDTTSNKLLFDKETNTAYQKWIIEVYNERLVFKNTGTKQVLSMNDKGEITLEAFDFSAKNLWDLTKTIETAIKTIKSFKYFSQNDPAWSEEAYSWAKMRNAGCGPTSLSMITNYLSDKDANPLIIARISKQNKLDIKEPPRTDMDKLVPLITKDFGFNYKKIDKTLIVSELKQGRMVMMSTWANKKIHYNGYGHFLVLRGLDKKGNIIVNDPLPLNTYGVKAESYIENYKEDYVYVAKPEELFKELFLAYSFWK